MTLATSEEHTVKVCKRLTYPIKYVMEKRSNGMKDDEGSNSTLVQIKGDGKNRDGLARLTSPTGTQPVRLSDSRPFDIAGE
jgi:hypothetical protein